jgi:hypothetical protein
MKLRRFDRVVAALGVFAHQKAAFGCRAGTLEELCSISRFGNRARLARGRHRHQDRVASVSERTRS